MPAATAARMPFVESSTATHRDGDGPGPRSTRNRQGRRRDRRPPPRREPSLWHAVSTFRRRQYLTSNERTAMALEGEYAPSPWEVVAEQVRQYESSGGKEGGTLEGKPVIILTTRGRRSGKVRKTALMRVEHDGHYAVVASMGGAPQHPVWFLNLEADPNVTLQDGANVMSMRAR